MKILAIETATAWQSIAILEDDVVLARRDQDAGSAHGLLLLPSIDRMLAEAGLQLSSLDGLACSIGPGSFTGIRVGVATCLGLRAATGLPLALVPTLEAMAWGVRSTMFPICPILTSRRGELYWAIFRRQVEGGLDCILSEHAGPPGLLAKSLPEHSLVFGDGWVSMESEIRAALSSSATVSSGPQDVGKPSAVNVAILGMHRLRRGDIAGDCVAPRYVQRTEAELKYEQSGGLSATARRQERVAVAASKRSARGHQRKGQGPRPGRPHGS